MATPLRWDLLPAIIDNLPADEAQTVGLLDPLDHLAHVEAYAALRRNGIEIDHLLLHDFLVGLLTFLEQPAEMLERYSRERRSARV